MRTIAVFLPPSPPISPLPPSLSLSNIQVLILDQNRLESHVKFPVLPSLHTLSVNGNRIRNLAVFISLIKTALPGLRHFSMLNNEACPNYFNGGTDEEYADYRCYVVYHLPQLSALDHRPVAEEERREARRLYGGGSRLVRGPRRAVPSVAVGSAVNAPPGESVATDTYDYRARLAELSEEEEEEGDAVEKEKKKEEKEEKEEA